MKHLLPLLLVPLLLAGPAAAKDRRKKAPPVDPKVAAIVAPLLERLDSPSYKERESATRALKELGPIAETSRVGGTRNRLLDLSTDSPDR